jgi:hypothetical protein
MDWKDWLFIVILGVVAGLFEVACSYGVATFSSTWSVSSCLEDLPLVLLAIVGLIMTGFLPARRRGSILSAFWAGAIGYTLWFAWLWIYDSSANPTGDHGPLTALLVFAIAALLPFVVIFGAASIGQGSFEKRMSRAP